jgi:hypothetical protein
MTTSDAPEFRRLMMRLDTVFDKPSSTVRADEYFQSLRDVPFALVGEAVTRHIARARTYPRPAELRKLADEAQGVDDEPMKRLMPPTRRVTPGEPAPPPVYHCQLCEDNGWLFFEQAAPLYGPDATVDVVRRCHCYKTNPALVAPKRYAHKDADFHRTW